MIRLTLHAQSKPEVHLFNKSTIFIGRDPSEVDLVLSNPLLQPTHLKIFEQNGSPYILNMGNDPFVSINGNPFGKKQLKSGDIIGVHDTDILFEQLKPDQAILEENVLDLLLNNKIKQQISGESTTSSGQNETFSKSFLDLDLPFEKELETFKDDEWKTSQMDDLKQESKISPKSENKLAASPKTTSKNKNSDQKGSLKDDYLRDLDDDNQTKSASESGPIFQDRKWIFLFIFSILAIAIIIGTVIFFSVSDKTEAQETKAAQGVADISMALMHAQLYHLKPHNQNWSDVEFLKNNLQNILPNTFSYALDIDSHGQFKRFPYSLRIYTTSDLSHFLLIAQPAPSLLQWLIPKSVILVDSQSMEIRTIKDVRSLNRLLANPDPLEGSNGKEISSLIKQGTLLRLSSLISHADPNSFIPPKSLVWIHPGSENFIYNAPRYYLLGQSLIQKALSLSTSKGTSQEVTSFKKEVDSFSKLNHLVLYADQGKQTAFQIKQGIVTFAPTDKILFGYITFDSEGKIQHASLLKEDEEEIKPGVSAIDKTDKDYQAIALNTNTANPIKNPSKANVEAKSDEKDSPSQIDVNHPIYALLTSLVKTRESDLAPLGASLKELVDNETTHPTSSFQMKFNDLVHRYGVVDSKHKTLINDSLNSLFQQYEEIPINQFISYANETGCGQLICHKDSSATMSENIEKILININQAKSFIELDNLIRIASSWLTFDYLKNADNLMQYQNRLRNQVLIQLEKLILSDKKISNYDLLVQKEKQALKHILNNERIIKPEEKDFFLDEFDHDQALTNNAKF